MKRILLLSAFAHSVLMSAVAEGGEGSASVETNATERDTAKIRPNLEGYQTAKSASGASTKICGDEVSKALLGATLGEAYKFVAGVVDVSETDLRTKYEGRNPGQQRMFLGNLIRGAFAGKDVEKASRVSKAFEAALPEFRVAIDARLSNEAAAKQKLKDDKAAERETAKLATKAKREEEAKAKADEKAKAKAAADQKKIDDKKIADDKAAQKVADKAAADELKASKGSK